MNCLPSRREGGRTKARNKTRTAATLFLFEQESPEGRGTVYSIPVYGLYAVARICDYLCGNAGEADGYRPPGRRANFKNVHTINGYTVVRVQSTQTR